MVDYDDFRCRTRIPEIELGDVASARKALIELIAMQIGTVRAAAS
jgi:hypothetical protein